MKKLMVMVFALGLMASGLWGMEAVGQPVLQEAQQVRQRLRQLEQERIQALKTKRSQEMFAKRQNKKPEDFEEYRQTFESIKDIEREIDERSDRLKHLQGLEWQQIIEQQRKEQATLEQMFGSPRKELEIEAQKIPVLEKQLESLQSELKQLYEQQSDFNMRIRLLNEEKSSLDLLVQDPTHYVEAHRRLQEVEYKISSNMDLLKPINQKIETISVEADQLVREINRLSEFHSQTPTLTPISPTDPALQQPSRFTRGQKIAGAGIGLAGLAAAGIGAGTFAWKKVHERIASVLAQHGMQLNQLTDLQRNLLRAIWTLTEWTGKMRFLRYYIQRYGVGTIISTPQMWNIIAEIYYRRPVTNEEVQSLRRMVEA